MTHPGGKLNFMGNEIGQFIEWRYYEGIEYFLAEEYENHRKHQQAFIAALNKFYNEQPAMWQKAYESDGFEWIVANNADQCVISYVRHGDNPDDDLVVLINFEVNPYEEFRIGRAQGRLLAGGLQLRRRGVRWLGRHQRQGALRDRGGALEPARALHQGARSAAGRHGAALRRPAAQAPKKAAKKPAAKKAAAKKTTTKAAAKPAAKTATKKATAKPAAKKAATKATAKAAAKPAAKKATSKATTKKGKASQK